MPTARSSFGSRVEDGLESLIEQPTGLQPPGTVPQIAGFTIERELGRGAMGVVYLARRDTPQAAGRP